MKKILLILFIILLVSPVFAATWQMSQARQEFAKAEYTKALKTMNEVIQTATYLDEEAYSFRSQIKFKLNDVQGAIGDISKAIEIKPSADLHRQRLNLYLSIEDYMNAMKDLGWFISNPRTDEIELATSIMQSPKIPAFFKATACILRAKIKATVLRDLNGLAADGYKLIQIIAQADEKDMLFVKQSKQELLKDYKERFFLEGGSNFDNELQINLSKGFYEYAIGNKELGLKILYGTRDEWAIRLKKENTKLSPEGLNAEINIVNKLITTVLKELDSQ